MITEVTLSDGKKDFSFKVVGIDTKEFRQKMIDFVEIDVNILLSPPKEEEEERFYFDRTIQGGKPLEPFLLMYLKNQNNEVYTVYLGEKMQKIERKTFFLQMTKEVGVTRKELEDWFKRNDCELKFN